MSSIKENIIRIKNELPSNVELVAVSKFHTPDDILEAYGAGQRVFGESRPQEFCEKARMLPDDIVWHFIGHLQTNKLKKVLPYVSVVESVDSERLLSAIDRWGAENGKVTDVFLEVHIASEASKQGFAPDEVLEVLSRIGSYGNVRVRGLMGMATFTDDDSIVRSDFSRLVSLRDRILDDESLSSALNPGFGLLSFGMSSDYRTAVRMGTDIVRIGTSIFGERDYSK